MHKLLLIEDDLEMQSLIVAYLTQSKYNVIATHLPSKALEILQGKDNIDLIILDLTLPEMDGFKLCKKIRKITQVPIIISSARGDVYNKVEGFDKGADDYLAKPYEPVELLVRVNALLRRLKPKNIEFDNMSINIETRNVVVDGMNIDLTPTEFDILLFLIENRQKPMSREQIANSITAMSEDTTLRSIDTHIRNIRSKINDNAKEPKFIQSVWGIGYKFCI
ncbi:response regulator transcription factor [Helicobacter sp. MIT 14-3879]|uniref:response regulator transcription factor n=1 Tax=Helicobacter sp. MIT 14-3879 TaxID=2040649 RepID=UPI000E1EAC3B|nr:response regulator transcription factor [Helicobacter sp. MIT 14-3879]RDU65422.1 DNA-binding response regulator [Helicobacter sp. MIT 14-3879]